MKTIHSLYKALLVAPLLFTATLSAQSNYSSLFSSTSAISQLRFDEKQPNYKPDYHNAIGIRAGGTSGITFKHFFRQTDAIEGILGLWPNAFGLTVLYERHVGIQGAPGLKFYYGGGGHITGETGRYYYGDDRRDYRYRYGRNGFGIGIDGIVGIEYKIPVIPFAISLDLKPFIEASNYGNIYTAIDPALGIKVAF